MIKFSRLFFLSEKANQSIIEAVYRISKRRDRILFHMPNQNIEFSKEGVKISYLRLLSDSTCGFILILFGVLIYYFPIYGNSLQNSLQKTFVVPPEIKILVLVLLVLITTPLGLIINVVSWICFGPIQVWWQKRFFIKRRFDFPAKNVKEEIQFEKYKDFFRLSDKEIWYRCAQLIKQSLPIYYPQILDNYEHVRGVRTLFRNISFLLFLFFISIIFRICFVSEDRLFYFWIAVFSFLISFLFMKATGIIGFFYNSQIYMKVYILCLEIDDCDKLRATTEHNIDKEIINKLSRSAKLRAVKENP